MFADELTTAASSNYQEENIIDRYVAAPGNPALPIDTISLIQPASIYDVRLGQIINAYWTCMTMPYALSAGLTGRTSYLDPNVSFAITDPIMQYRNRTMSLEHGLKARLWQAEGTRNRNVEVFHAHRGWVATLCIASALLVIASLVPLAVRCFLSKGPDLMMNISSLATRNNPYIPTGALNTYLDASDRARLLKDCKVRFGDVDFQAEVGKLVLAECDDGAGLEVEEVKKERVYR